MHVKVRIVSAQLLEQVRVSAGLPALRRDAPKFDQICERQNVSFDGDEMYPSLLEKCAALVHGILKFHPLTDGNKRLAYLALDLTLQFNGYEIDPTIDAITMDQMIRNIAGAEGAEPHDLHDWLLLITREGSAPRPRPPLQ